MTTRAMLAAVAVLLGLAVAGCGDARTQDGVVSAPGDRVVSRDWEESTVTVDEPVGVGWDGLRRLYGRGEVIRRTLVVRYDSGLVLRGVAYVATPRTVPDN